jgi:outer membrane immunogenic protein
MAAGPVIAADIPVKAPLYKAPPPIVYSWAGFYIGANAGGAWGKFNPTTSVMISPIGVFSPGSPEAVAAVGLQSIKPTGFAGGGQVGINWQTGRVVYGLEGDIESFSLKGTATGSGVYPCCAPTVFTIVSAASTSWLATARGRLGVASNNWLFFATGGAAFTNVKGVWSYTDDCGAQVNCRPGPAGPAFNSVEGASISNTKTGYAVGGGVEAALWGNWTAKAEYLYVSFGTASTTSFITSPGLVAVGSNNNPFTHTISLKANIARVGINYKFGGPVVAGY